MLQAELELKICYHRLSAMVLGVNITIGVIIFLNHQDRLFCDVFETTNNRYGLFHDYYNGPTINRSDASPKSKMDPTH